MELKEAIEILGAFKLANIIEMITVEEFEDVKTAIDTVLEELNNRIPKKIIEDKTFGLKNKNKSTATVIRELDNLGLSVEVYNAEHNIINIIEKELLNKE